MLPWQGLRGYEAAGGGSRGLLSAWRDRWVDQVQAGLQQFFVGLLAAALELAGMRWGQGGGVGNW